MLASWDRALVVTTIALSAFEADANPTRFMITTPQRVVPAGRCSMYVLAEFQENVGGVWYGVELGEGFSATVLSHNC